MATADGKEDRLSYSENDRGSFQKHNESMKRFYLAHPNLAIRPPYYVKPIGQLASIPLPLVELERYVQN